MPELSMNCAYAIDALCSFLNKDFPPDNKEEIDKITLYEKYAIESGIDNSDEDTMTLSIMILYILGYIEFSSILRSCTITANISYEAFIKAIDLHCGNGSAPLEIILKLAQLVSFYIKYRVERDAPGG